MPTENDTATAPDPRDVRIKELEKRVKDLDAEVNELSEDRDEQLSAYETQVEALKARLDKQEVGTFTGDFVFLDGKQYSVVKTVRANTTFDEVKKGNVDEGVTLVVITRPH